MNSSEVLEQAQKAIQTGERTRILFEMLLSEIGLTFENTNVEIWNRLQETQKDYEDAVKTMAMIINDTRKNTPEKEGVSVSNY